MYWFSLKGLFEKKSSLQLLEETWKLKIYQCPCCWVKQVHYKVHISKIHIQILMKVRAYCFNNWIHEFKIKDLDNELWLSKTEYWNLNVLCRFGLLYRKTDDEWKRIKGWYWINIWTTDKFIKNEWKVAAYYTRNVQNKTHELSEERITINQVKWIDEKFMQENNLPSFVNYI